MTRTHVDTENPKVPNTLILQEYIQYRIMVAGIRDSTCLKISTQLRPIMDLLPCDYVVDVTQSDLIFALNKRRAMVAPATFHGDVRTVKAFFKWLVKYKNCKLDLEILREIKNPQPASTVRVEDLLTDEEIGRLMHATENSRDRLIISLLRDSGGRVSETTVSMTWGSLVFDKYGVQLNLDGKTKIPRLIRLSSLSIPYLLQWKADYPGEVTDESPLFPSLYRKRDGMRESIDSDGIRTVLQRCAKRAGITKRIYPHLFRHTAITQMIREKVPIQMVSMRHYGTPTSQAISRYIHLAAPDVDNYYLEYYGLKAAEEREMNPGYCPRCNTMVSPYVVYCNTCGAALSEELKVSADDVDANVSVSIAYVEELERQIRELREVVMGEKAGKIQMPRFALQQI